MEAAVELCQLKVIVAIQIAYLYMWGGGGGGGGGKHPSNNINLLLIFAASCQMPRSVENLRGVGIINLLFPN